MISKLVSTNYLISWYCLNICIVVSKYRKGGIVSLVNEGKELLKANLGNKQNVKKKKQHKSRKYQDGHMHVNAC